jgi:hypothetical protein
LANSAESAESVLSEDDETKKEKNQARKYGEMIR